MSIPNTSQEAHASIKLAAESKGVSLSHLCRLSGVNYPTVFLWPRRKGSYNGSIYIKLMEAAKGLKRK